MEHFYITFGVAIVIAIITWSLRRPAKQLDDGGIVLKYSIIIYGVLTLPIVIIVGVIAVVVSDGGLNLGKILIIGVSVLILILFVWLTVFLLDQKVIVTDEGVMEQKRKRQKYLKWIDVEKVEYIRRRGWMKLLGDTDEVTVNLGLIGSNDFLTLMQQKLPSALCEEAVNDARRYLGR